LGGGIYIGDQSLTVNSSSFIENDAFQGGAIATMSSNKAKLVDLKQSIFQRNNASQGAALAALRTMNFDYSTSSFQDNTAIYGRDITSIPTSLRLKIYSVDSYFLYLNETSPQDLLSNPATSVIYDSATADASESIAFISGANPNLLFEVTILDAFGNKIGLTENAYFRFLRFFS